MRGEAIMSVLSLLLQICAITWFNPDGSQKNKAEFVWPEDIVSAIVTDGLATNPKLTYEVKCKEAEK